MELYAKGQLSFLILTCMQERDFYGLDIISAISERSNGRINLKKPSVYSNLTRMEKQGYISSYLKSSDFGPNRKYYSLTEKGREFYQELKSYFERNNIDVFKAFDEDSSPTIERESFLSNESEPIVNDAELSEKEEDDFFDFSFTDEENIDEDSTAPAPDLQVETAVKESPIEENTVEETTYVQPASNTYSIRQALLQQKNEVVEEKKEEKKLDDAVFISQERADEYNRKIYDISKDINKYRKKRSFAEDQISMSNTDALAISQDKTKTNIEDFKNALLQNKNKYQDKRLNHDDFFKKMGGYRSESVEQVKEEPKNDAIFITNRLDSNNVEKAKKIEPPRLKIVSENSRDNKLPAPNRDVTIDPSHKEILTQLYSKTRDNASQDSREDAIYDYNDLKDYYDTQNLPFSVYQKPKRKLKHNTNKIYMVVSLITFIVVVACSAITYAILSGASLINANTSFLYYLLPALLLIDLAYRIYKFKMSRGWLPKQMLPQWAIWVGFVGLCAIVTAINFACGLASASFDLFATSLILPMVIGLVVLPVRYYTKRIAIVKYWR
ncbi:MAG: PadR family transcriptional regulator [Clostridia bacterium]|nr:PadR family transcriptional regulator [Clostridia bacterium]